MKPSRVTIVDFAPTGLLTYHRPILPIVVVVAECRCLHASDNEDDRGSPSLRHAIPA